MAKEKKGERKEESLQKLNRGKECVIEHVADDPKRPGLYGRKGKQSGNRE